MNLRDLVMLTDSKIELWVTGAGKWGAGFVGGEIKEGCTLKGAIGWGDTAAEAVLKLAWEVSGQRLVFDAMTKQRREYTVPPDVEP